MSNDEYTDNKSFCVVPKHGKLKWNLPEYLDKYTNKHCNKLFPGNDLLESILVDNSVTVKLHLPRKMD